MTVPVDETVIKYINTNTVESVLYGIIYSNNVINAVTAFGIFHQQSSLRVHRPKSMTAPVWTLSPTFSSDILTDFASCRVTLAAEGKQPPPPDGGGGGGSESCIVM